MFIQTPEDGKWMTTIGEDAFVHIIPLGEEHDFHCGCICNPVQKNYATGEVVFTHRVLTC